MRSTGASRLLLIAFTAAFVAAGCAGSSRSMAASPAAPTRPLATSPGAPEASRTDSGLLHASPGTGALPLAGQRSSAEVPPGLASAQGGTAALGRKGALRIPVLMYHLIEATPGHAAYPGLYVPPARFAAQMAALKAAGWHTITAAELASMLATGQRPTARSFVVTFDDGRESDFSEGFRILQQDGFVGTFYVIADRVGRPRYMDWTQLAEMQAAGMEIGNHTFSHRDLAALPLAAAADEIDRAQTTLTAHGLRVSTFAYPIGAFADRVIPLVRAAGLMLAVTTQPGATESLANRYTVPRIRVGPSLDPAALVRRMAGYSGV